MSVLNITQLDVITLHFTEELVYKYCNAEILVPSGEGGFLQSPGYPLFYLGGTTCEWTFKSLPGQVINITFHDLNIRGKYLCMIFNQTSNTHGSLKFIIWHFLQITRAMEAASMWWGYETVTTHFLNPVVLVPVSMLFLILISLRLIWFLRGNFPHLGDSFCSIKVRYIIMALCFHIIKKLRLQSIHK